MTSDQDGQSLPDLDTLWDFDDPAASEARFRELLTVATAGSAHDSRAEVLTQVARAQGLQRCFAAAHETLDEAERLLDSAGPAGLRARVRYLLERGRVFNTAGEPDRAGSCFVAAWDLAREHGEDALAVDAAHMLGIALPLPASLEWNQRALALAESSPDPKARHWLGSLLNNLGWTFHDAGDYGAALDRFERASVWQEQHGTPASRRIARWCVARTLRSLSRVAEALERQRSLLAELAGTGNHDGFVDEEVGECLLALGRTEEARPHFARAYAALSNDPGMTEREPERLHRLRALATG